MIFTIILCSSKFHLCRTVNDIGCTDEVRKVCVCVGECVCVCVCACGQHRIQDTRTLGRSCFQVVVHFWHLLVENGPIDDPCAL